MVAFAGKNYSQFDPIADGDIDLAEIDFPIKRRAFATAERITFPQLLDVKKDEIKDGLGLGSAAEEDVSAFDVAGTAVAAVAAHEASLDPHPEYLTQAEADALYDAVGAATAAVSAHEGAANPHPQYLTEAEADALYDAEGLAAAAAAAAAAALTAHVMAADPHPVYLTAAEANAAYDAIGAAAAAVTAHEAASDPHPQYQTAAEVLAAVVGKQSVWIPAGALTPRLTNGAALGLMETPTNKVMLQTLDFDATTVEYAQFPIRMPKSWNEGTLSAIFVWSHPAAVTNFDVVWGIQALALSDGDVIDAAFGAAQTVTDSGGTTDTSYQSAETAAMTAGGAPAEADLVIFQVYRDAAAGGDTLAVDARLRGVLLFYTTNAANDA